MSGESALEYGDNANNNGSRTRPSDTSAYVKDHSVVLPDAAKPASSGVPLCNRVGGNETESRPVAKEEKRAAEEMCYQIRVAICTIMQLHNPLGVSLSQRT